MRRVAGRMQTVGTGMLVLAVTVAAPALSAAQQGAADPNAAPTDPPLTTPAPPPEPPVEGQPEDGAAGQDGAPATEQVVSEAQAEATAPAPKPTPQKQAKVAAATTVSIGDNFYSPATVTINVGDTVTWQNDGAADHSATADDGSFDTGVFRGGQSRSETFSSAGTIPYFCTVHGQAQSGKVVVRSSGGGGGGGNDGGSGASSSGTSEAAAVASSGAAGSSTSLPATGFAAVLLAAIGTALVGSGSYLKRFERRGPRPRRVRFFSL